MTAPHIHNRRARHDYHIDEQIEAGIVRHGWEVKSFRAGHVSVAEGFARLDRGEVEMARIGPPPCDGPIIHGPGPAKQRWPFGLC